MKDVELNLKDKITPTERGNTIDDYNNGSKIEWDFERQSIGQSSRKRKQQKPCLALAVPLELINKAADINSGRRCRTF